MNYHAIQTSFIAPYHQLNKNAVFKSKNRYHTFLNWISGEFDLYLQDETNGLQVYFPEGKFHIINIIENGNIAAEINLKSKNLEKGQLIFNKIVSIYELVLKN